MKSVENSGTAVGARCSDGVVIAVEKVYHSRMMMKGSLRRVHFVEKHIGVGIAGLLPDGRQMVSKCREEATQYREVYGEPVPGRVLADRLARFTHLYTLYWHVRSFGCSALVAAYDGAEGPQLYMVEPSGMLMRYNACATGKAKQQAKTELEKLKLGELTCREAVTELAKTIVNVHDNTKDKLYELEMLWVCEESGRTAQFVPQELIDEARKAAEDEKDREDDDDDMDDA
mmetsp:Transcript_38003/g.151007  ORF Transcript_38003/g.151007 Transcript_38003/m.151007 type:complete len:230 (-) Transcript_38003:162-851(-)